MAKAAIKGFEFMRMILILAAFILCSCETKSVSERNNVYSELELLGYISAVQDMDVLKPNGEIGVWRQYRFKVLGRNSEIEFFTADWGCSVTQASNNLYAIFLIESDISKKKKYQCVLCIKLDSDAVSQVKYMFKSVEKL